MMIYEAKGNTEFTGNERGNSIWVETLIAGTGLETEAGVNREDRSKDAANTKDISKTSEDIARMLNEKQDVIVIGGGLAGILTAYRLTNAGLKVLVLEASRVGHGMTKNTTAKITSQHGYFYHQLLKQQGREKALQYVTANENAISAYEDIISAEQIDCNFLRLDNYVYTLTDVKKMEEEKKAADILGLDTVLTDRVKLPFEIKVALCKKNQAQFHPLKFINAMKEKVSVLEGVFVRSIDEKQAVETNVGRFQADHIVVATHYPIINRPGYYFLRLHQERSYLMCIEDSEHPESLRVDGMYIDENKSGMTFRNYNQYLLLGMGDHRTGEKKLHNYYGNLLCKAGEYYPNATIVSTWSNQDCMTPDSIPYIGRYTRKSKNLYVATGFNMWGMSSSMVAADILSDMICGKKNACEDVFSPQRSLIKGVKKLVKSASVTSIALSKEILGFSDTKLSKIRRGQAGIVKIDGRRIGVYHDNRGTFYYVSTKCPHLGCSLEWNKNEATWDCPCHGSRFDYKGNLLSNPSSRETYIGCRRKDKS